MATTTSTANTVMIDSLDRVWESIRDVLDDLPDAALAWRPAPGANSIAWLIWHLTRVVDDHVAGIAAHLDHPGAEQVWLAGGFYERSGLPFPPQAHGYGQSSADVAAVQLDARFLREYHDAVHAQAVAVVADLTDDDYATVVDTRFTPAVTAGVRLVSLVNDATQHVGQAAYLRGLFAQSKTDQQMSLRNR